ncbi:MAG: hypothetical protein V3U87_06710 [Methylococcaceae bacterium]
MSNKFFSISTSKYKTFCITLLFLQLIWTIPAQAIVEFNEMRDMWLNERYSEVLPLLLEADSKYGVELEYMIGTSACRIKGQQTQELGLALLKRILSEQRLSKTEHESLKVEISQCNNIIAFLYGAEKKTSIQSKEVVFYRQEDNQMALLQANDTENSFAGVGLNSNNSNAQKGSHVVVSTSNVSSGNSDSNAEKSSRVDKSTPSSDVSSDKNDFNAEESAGVRVIYKKGPRPDNIKFNKQKKLPLSALKKQVLRLIATNGQKLRNIKIKGNFPLKKCPDCVKPKTWKKPDSLKNKPSINLSNQPNITKGRPTGNKIGARPIISKRIATGSNLVTPKITSLPKVTGSKVKMPKPTTPRATAPKNIAPKFMAPKRTIPTTAAPKRSTSRVVTPRRTAPTASVPRKTTSRVTPTRRTAPTASVPRKTTSRVTPTRRTAPTASVLKRTTSRVAAPRKTTPTTAALRKTRPGIAQ